MATNKRKAVAKFTSHCDEKGCYTLFLDGHREYHQLFPPFPETYKGYPVKDLLKTWDEIQQPGGTKADKKQIGTMHDFLKEYRLGIFAVVDPG